MYLEIRGRNLRLSDSARDRIERRLTFALGRLGRRVREVRVTLARLSGRRGGTNKRCLMVANLRRIGQVVVEHRATRWGGAVAGAAGRLGHTLRRRLPPRHRRHRIASGPHHGTDPARRLREEV